MWAYGWMVNSLQSKHPEARFYAIERLVRSVYGWIEMVRPESKQTEQISAELWLKNLIYRNSISQILYEA